MPQNCPSRQSRESWRSLIQHGADAAKEMRLHPEQLPWTALPQAGGGMGPALSTAIPN